MAEDKVPPEKSTDEEENGRPAIVRRRVKDTAELDITPMIDITFLLLIFFLVASTPDPSKSVELPPARYGQGVSERNSQVITIAKPDESRPALVYLGDRATGEPLPEDPAEQEARIVAAVEAANKPNVLIKAAKRVLHHEVARVAAAAGRVEGIKLHCAVFETK